MDVWDIITKYSTSIARIYFVSSLRPGVTLMARIYHKIVNIDSADLQSVPIKIGDSKCLATIYIESHH